MAYKSKDQLKNIHKSQNPSTTSTSSRSHSKSPDHKSKVVETSPSSPEVLRQPPSSNYTPESPEFHSLIHKLEQIPISAKKPKRSKASEESVTSLSRETSVLTQLQIERLRVNPFLFPIHCRHNKFATSIFESDTSEITSPFHPFTSPFTESTQSTSSTSITTSSTNLVVSSSPSIPTSGLTFPFS